jgi:hypothetical protein
VRLTRRGKVVWQEWFVEQRGWNQTLEAVGLSEYEMLQESVETRAHAL